MENIQEQLRFALANKLNVILIGKHGIGKTHLVTNAFEEAGLSYRYFSGATMDAYTQFLGIPFRDEDGTLDFAIPKDFKTDSIRAIFIDEFNRAPLAVKNALMELLQFKSVNGHKFNNLEVVWAAINPDDDDTQTYDVEAMDPAQFDRFHLQITVPQMISNEYFKKKHGAIGTIACNWWNALSKENKDLCSPRRLDYACQVYKLGGDLSAVLNKNLHIAGLLKEFRQGSVVDTLKDAIANNDKDTIVELISDPDSDDLIRNHFIDPARETQDFESLQFLKYAPAEKMAMYMNDDSFLCELFLKGFEDESDMEFARLRESYMESLPSQTALSLAKTIAPSIHNEYRTRQFSRSSVDVSAANGMMPTRMQHSSDISNRIAEFDRISNDDTASTNARIASMSNVVFGLANAPLPSGDDAITLANALVRFCTRSHQKTVTGESHSVAKIVNMLKKHHNREIRNDKIMSLKNSQPELFI